MKLMHVADLHLDSPFIGMSKQFKGLHKQLIQAPFQAFERSVAIAINRKVDVFVIAGDIYDAKRQTIPAQHFFMKQLNRLDKAGIPVVMSHGNHDYLDLDKLPVHYPKNVHLFPNDQVQAIDLTLKDQTTVRFYGFSYTSRWVNERKIKDYPRNPRETDLTVGILHGSAEGVESKEGNYAPFSLQELLTKQYDYWALGHIHQVVQLHDEPLIQYPGTIQGRHRHETGDKGAFLIELGPNQATKNEFFSLAPIVWQAATIECQVNWSASDVLQQLEQVIANYESEAEASQQSQILSVTLNNAQRLSEELQEQIEAGELLMALTEPTDVVPFVAITRISLKHHMAIEAFQYDERLNASFLEATQQLDQGDSYQDIMQDVFQHPLMRKWLEDLSEDQELQASITESAKQLMIQSIGFETKEVTHEN